MTPLALLTQHRKADAVAAPLAQAGFSVRTIGGFDTDTLGTFTGEVARRGTQRDAALTKAQTACALSGLRYGLGSEGSFGPDPYLGVSPWGVEMLAWWDAERQYAVTAVVQGSSTNYAQTTASTWEQALAFAKEAHFPAHGIIVGRPGQAHFSKETTAWPELEQRIRAGLETGPVWLETDMRAHRNPTRMAMIAQCAERLAATLQRTCPACAQPGFGMESPVPGAQCLQCGLPTQAPKAKKIECPACGHTAEEPITARVPPSRCGYCNP